MQEVQNVDKVDTEETAVVETTETEEKKVDVNQLAAQLEQIKKAQAGSDKAYQETAKQLAAVKAENDKLRKSSMDAEERAAFERQQKEQELEERERAVNNANLQLSLIKELGAAEMDTEWAEYVPVSDPEKIEESIGKLKELIEKEVGRRVDKTLNSSSKPKAGDTPAGKAAIDFQNMSLQDIEKLAKEGKLQI